MRVFEWRGCLGGVWTAGLLGYLLDFDKPGFNQELLKRLEAREMRRGTQASLKELHPDDVLVSPDLGRMTSIDFSKMAQVMVAGEVAAAREQQRLASLGVSEERYAAWVAARVRAADPSLRVAFVRREGHARSKGQNHRGLLAESIDSHV